MNYKSVLRRAAVFVFGHILFLAAVMLFAGSVSRAGASASSAATSVLSQH